MKTIAYKIAENFIFRNQDLTKKYIEFLKDLKNDSKWEEYSDDIEGILSEYGQDEVSLSAQAKYEKEQGIW